MKFEFAPQQGELPQSKSQSDSEMPLDETQAEEVSAPQESQEAGRQNLTEEFKDLLAGRVDQRGWSQLVRELRKEPTLTIELTAEELLSKANADGILVFLKAFIEDADLDQVRNVSIQGTASQRDELIASCSNAANVLNSGVDFIIE